MSNILTKKDVNNARNRWLTSAQICFNYETMQSASVVYAVGPCLEKIYANKPDDLRASLLAHFRFFNTQPWMGNIILSAALAIEETGGENAIETGSAIRTSLMGPFAGLGDSIFFVLPKTVLGALAAYMAIEGNYTGVFLAGAIGAIMFLVRIKMWDIAYVKGVQFITSSQSRLNSLTDAASVMGLVVVGALIASNVRVVVPYVFKIGESTTKLSDIFDKIMPNMLPLLAVISTYWALGKKNMTSTKMVWVIIIVSVIAAYFKVLA